MALAPKVKKNVPQCGDGFWYQLVSINLSTVDSQCPDGWMEEKGEVRACGRGSVGVSCQSAFLNSDHQMEYTKVCGMAIGYQYGHTYAFAERSGDENVDQNYVDGLSITYGFPRQHLWTFAAAARKFGGPSIYNCPCSNTPGASPPPFVGDS